MKSLLSERIGIDEINAIVLSVIDSNERKQMLYNLLFDEDDQVSYQAAWVFTHFSSEDNKWLYPKQNELIDAVMQCSHPGKRRLLLSMLHRQPMPDPPRTDFLDYCLEKMLSKQELPGVQSLAMKLAYEMCRPIPELLQELRSTLEMMETDLLSAGLRTARNNVIRKLKAKNKK